MLRVVMGQDGIDKGISIVQIADLATQKLHELLPLISPYARVLEILQKLSGMGAKIGLASNNFNSIIDAMISTFRWSPYVSSFAGIDEFPPDQRKPHPAMIQKVLNDFQLSPAECVMIGDSVYDIRAGQQAGCYTVALCTGNSKYDQFLKLNPNKILPSITDLYSYLPLFFD